MSVEELTAKLAGMGKIQLELVLQYVNHGEPELVARAITYVENRA